MVDIGPKFLENVAHTIVQQLARPSLIQKTPKRHSARRVILDGSGTEVVEIVKLIEPVSSVEPPTGPINSMLPPAVLNMPVKLVDGYVPTADGKPPFVANTKAPTPAPPTAKLHGPKIVVNWAEAVPNAKHPTPVPPTSIRSLTMVQLVVPSVRVKGVKAGESPFTTKFGAVNENAKLWSGPVASA